MANIILIILFLLILVGSFFFYNRKLSKTPVSEAINDTIGERITLDSQIDRVAEQFNSLIKEDLTLKDYSEKEYKEKERTKNEVLTNLDKASKGDIKARDYIKAQIYDMLVKGYTNLKVTDIDRIIPFSDSSRLTGIDMFEIMFHYYLKKAEAELRKLKPEERILAPEASRIAMKNLITENGFDKTITDPNTLEERHIVTFEKMKEAYKRIAHSPDCVLSARDKWEILTQRIYEEYKGYSVADIFLSGSGVDEVDAGISGIPKTGFQVKMLKGMQYSYEHLWITWHGENILFKCLGFGSVEGLQRVVNNIYKYNPPHALSEDAGYVACSNATDARIVVCMPPFSEDYAFFARMHDTVAGLAPEQMITHEGAEDVITLIKWIVRGEQSLLATGVQGSGKTTFLKMLFNFVTEKNIRVSEMMMELGLRAAFPDKNIFTFQETGTVSMEEGIDLSKKSNGYVYCVGEIATAPVTGRFVQLCQRGGAQAFATYHGKTTEDTVKSMGQDLVECGIAQELSEAEAKVAEVVNVNIHLDNDRDKIDIETFEKLSAEEKERVLNSPKSRHIGYIDEIVPTIGIEYPHKTPVSTEEMWENTSEYYARETDRRNFTVNNLVSFENGKLVLKNLPTEAMQDRIADKLSRQEEIEFRMDMRKLKAKLEAV